MDDIHKIQLTLVTHQEFAVGPQCRPLCIQMQGDKPCIWYETQKPVVHSHRLGIWLIGTGTELLGKVPAHADYLGTVQMDGGALVYHCYCTHYKVKA